VFREEWFGPGNQTALYNCAVVTKDVPGYVVEVGSWEGRSTVQLARGAYPALVHAVDTWEGSPGEISAELARERNVFATFAQNMDELTDGNVIPHRMGWREFFATDRGPIRLLHIDAEHTYEEVRDTIAATLQKMSHGGIMCGDDFHHEPVRRAVLEAFPHVTAAGENLWLQQC